MIFQTLDDKTECVGIYADQNLIFEPKEFPLSLSQTWSVAPYFREKEIEYASLYLEGRTLEEVLPEYILDDWGDACKRMRAFQRALSLSKVDTHETCFFDLVPQRFLIELCEVKNRITEHVLKHIDRPRRYEFYKHVSFLLQEIGGRRINVDHRLLRSHAGDKVLERAAQSLIRSAPFVKYNQFGTKTGRLTTKAGTFPILTLNKKLRGAVKPCNDFFIELDFNGAEVRTLLGLMEKSQPAEDVHEFHRASIFTSLNSREEAKTAFFAWLYGSRSAAQSPEAKELAIFYDKGTLLDKYWKDEAIVTPFGKIIKNVSRHHALNYLVQSTAAELALKQFLKLDYVLRQHSSGSWVSFIIHDAVVLDMKREDEGLLETLCSLMGSTNFGSFGINIKKGKSLGTMRSITLG
jgi:hypothetical protein